MINTTYGEVRQAYAAITTLTRAELQIPLAAALRWKRVIGVLRPLVEQASEMQDELLREHAEKDAAGEMVAGDQPGTVRLRDMRAYSAALRELNDVPVTVGCDTVREADFGAGDALVGSGLVASIIDLGPFFEEAPHEQA